MCLSVRCSVCGGCWTGKQTNEHVLVEGEMKNRAEKDMAMRGGAFIVGAPGPGRSTASQTGYLLHNETNNRMSKEQVALIVTQQQYAMANDTSVIGLDK